LNTPVSKIPPSARVVLEAAPLFSIASSRPTVPSISSSSSSTTSSFTIFSITASDGASKSLPAIPHH